MPIQRVNFWIITVALTAPLAAGSAAIAGESQKPRHDDATEKAMMARWMEVASPGQPHRHLARSAGRWTTVSEVFVDGPDAPPRKTTGVCETEMVLGGRFALSMCDGEIFGRPFEGIGLSGYDNFRQKYVSTWADSMATAIMHMSGTCSDDGACTFYGESDQFLTGKIGRLTMASLSCAGISRETTAIPSVTLCSSSRGSTSSDC